MNSPANKLTTKPDVSWSMYRALVGVGIVSALIIAWIVHMTDPIIRKNKTKALEKAIFAVLPNAHFKVAFQLNKDGQFEKITDDIIKTAQPVYAAYDADKRLVGVAVQAKGMGYQDVIELLYGYAPAEEAIIGMTVLASRETPGLGSKIATDAEFLRNFDRLDVSLTADRKMIAHPIEMRRKIYGVEQSITDGISGSSTAYTNRTRRIDGISGATVSSKAVANILRRSTAAWIPKITRNLEDLELGDATDNH